jgi:hypothetical protein
MSERLDLERVVARWLDETAPRHASATLLDASLARVAVTTQDRPRFVLGGATVPQLSWRLALLLALTLLAGTVLGTAAGGWLLNTSIVVPVPTESPSQPTTPSQLAPRVAANGWIAFAADSMGGPTLADPVEYRVVETTPTDMDIYLVREGEPVRGIVSTEAHERCPTFSPDGTRLAYLESPVAGRSGETTLIVVELGADGDLIETDLRIPLEASDRYLPRLNTGPPCPQWSPDGRALAYLSYSESDQHETTRLRVSSAIDGETLLTTKRWVEIGGFAWSPAADAIAYTVLAPMGNGVDFYRNWSLSTVRLDDGGEVTLWPAPDETMLGSVGWSLNGEIALRVTTNIWLSEDSSRDEYSIAVVSADASESPRVVDDLVQPRRASWSTNGDTLAVVHSEGVALVDIDGSRRVDLEPINVDGERLPPSDILWSPDATRLLARAWRIDRGIVLVSMALDGTDVDVLTPWTWAFDWGSLEDASWQPVTGG